MRLDISATLISFHVPWHRLKFKSLHFFYSCLYYKSDNAFRCFDFVAFPSNLQAAFHLRIFLVFLAAVIPLEWIFRFFSELFGGDAPARPFFIPRKKKKDNFAKRGDPFFCRCVRSHISAMKTPTTWLRSWLRSWLVDLLPSCKGFQLRRDARTKPQTTLIKLNDFLDKKRFCVGTILRKNTIFNE